jgi:hypothetical protein
MTSRWFRPRHGLLLSVFGDQGGHDMVQPFPEGFDMKFRAREKNHRWSPWFGMSMTIDPTSSPLSGVLFQLSVGGGFSVGEMSPDGRRLPRQQVQVKLVDSATSTGTLNDGFAVKMGC